MSFYGSIPGDAGEGAGRWPDVSLKRFQAGATLVLFMHPGCPCSRATLRELERIHSKVGDQMRARVVFLTGGSVPSESSTFAEAQRLASDPRLAGALTVERDPHGQLARAFGARTSGEALLYDRAGRLVFQGGVTPSRGHEGSNRGAETVVAAVHQGTSELVRTPVFGCALMDAE